MDQSVRISLSLRRWCETGRCEGNEFKINKSTVWTRHVSGVATGSISGFRFGHPSGNPLRFHPVILLSSDEGNSSPRWKPLRMWQSKVSDPSRVGNIRGGDTSCKLFFFFYSCRRSSFRTRRSLPTSGTAGPRSSSPGVRRRTLYGRLAPHPALSQRRIVNELTPSRWRLHRRRDYEKNRKRPATRKTTELD